MSLQSISINRAKLVIGTGESYLCSVWDIPVIIQSCGDRKYSKFLGGRSNLCRIGSFYVARFSAAHRNTSVIATVHLQLGESSIASKEANLAQLRVQIRAEIDIPPALAECGIDSPGYVIPFRRNGNGRV